MIGLRTELLFDATIEPDPPPQEIGSTPRGTRRISRFKGGKFHGPQLSGKILPGGGDWILVHPNKTREIDIRTTLVTNDGHSIYASVTGIQRFTAQFQARIDKLGNDAWNGADPSEYYFRTVWRFETSASNLSWLNEIIGIGTGRRAVDGIFHEVHALK